MTDAATPPCACLACGEVLDHAMHAWGDAPQPVPGAFSICIKCGHVQAFNDDLTFRELNDQEMGRVAGNPVILGIQKARGFIMKKAKQ